MVVIFITIFIQYTYDVFGSCWNMVKMIVNSKADALAKIAQHQLAINESALDASQPLKVGKAVKSRKRKPRKIGIRVKTHGKRGRPKKCEENPMEVEDPEINQDILQDDPIKIVEERGVSLTLNLDGGCCACILSFSANRRIKYSIVIPDQLVAIDNQNQEKVGTRSKLLEKIEYREYVSGKKFDLSEQLSKTYFQNDEDIYTDKSFANGEAVENTDDNLHLSSRVYEEELSDDVNMDDDDESCESKFIKLFFCSHFLICMLIL